MKSCYVKKPDMKGHRVFESACRKNPDKTNPRRPCGGCQDWGGRQRVTANWMGFFGGGGDGMRSWGWLYKLVNILNHGIKFTLKMVNVVTYELCLNL